MKIWQAWHVLSSMQISSRSYVKPGTTVHVKDTNAGKSSNVGKTTLRCSNDADRSSGRTQAHQYFGAANASVSEPKSCTSNYFPSSNAKAGEAQKSGGQSQIRASMVHNSHHQVLGGSVGNQNVHTSQIKQSEKCLVTDMDDDEILEVISFCKVLRSLICLFCLCD